MPILISTPRQNTHKRAYVTKKFVSDFNERTGNTVQYLEAPYEPNEYRKLVRGLEEEPEGGDRCKVCFDYRLDKTAQVAMDLGFDGLIVESHCNPDEAWSDAKQQVTPDILDYILSLLIVRSESSTTEGIRMLRAQIDEIDNTLMDLLAKRFRCCREIRYFKRNII